MTTRTQMNEAKVIATGPGRRTMSGELVPLGAKRDASARDETRNGRETGRTDDVTTMTTTKTDEGDR